MSQLQADKNIERYLHAVEEGLAMSDAQALEKLRKQASHLLEHIEEATVHLYEADRKEAGLLKAAIDELRVQAALGRMESDEKIDSLKHRIKSGLRHLNASLDKARKLTVEEKDTLGENLHEAWKRLDLEITLLYLRLSSAYERSGEKLSETRDEITDDLRTIRDSAIEHSEEVTHKFKSWVKRVEKKVSRRGHRVLYAIDDFFEGL